MNILTKYIASHDSSLCYFSEETGPLYLKLERYFQIKHLGFQHIIHPEIKNFKFTGSSNLKNLLKETFFNNFMLPVVKNLNSNYTTYLDIPYTNHHLKHALSIEFFEKTPCDVHIVIDGEGDFCWYSIFRNESLIDYGGIPETGISLGNAITHAGYAMGIKNTKSLDMPGKVMGLQSYGRFDESFYNILSKYNMKYTGDQKEYYGHKHNHIFQIPQNISKEEKLNFLHTAHFRAGEIVLEIFKKFAKPHEKIGYSGGVAHNVIWNTMIKKEYPNLVIYPHCGDEGMSFAMLEIFRRRNNLNKSKFVFNNFPYCQWDQAPDTSASRDVIYKTAKHLATGKIVAWYQGHGEVGPRALGNRSILMDPRIKNGKDIINRVKNRESFRPFGASILSEYAKEYFNLDFENPYMLYIGTTQKSNLEAITHIDNTCRVQTVNKDFNSNFRLLLEDFYHLTGCPVLLNTSLNEAGKPIAGWIKNAEAIYSSSPIDVLVVGNTMYEK